jgi:cobalt-zinc-cadmium efflux system outer membrane protein
MRSFRTVPVGTAFMLLAASRRAAALPPTPVVPSVHFMVSPLLQETVRTVWKASSEVAAARAELDAAQARARAAAQPVYNPTVSFDAENADVDRRTAGVSLALDFSGKRRARAEVGQAQVRAGEAALESVRRDVGGRWLKAWATAALAERKIELGRHRVDLMQRFDDLAGNRLAVGDISRPERDLAGLALGEAQMQQATLTGQQGAARATLLSIGGDAMVDVPPLPDGVLPVAIGFDAQPVDELPELREARARIEGADASVRVAERARVPDPTVSLTGGQVRNGPLNDRVIGINVSIPLPVLNTGRAEVDAARADADAASALLQSRRLILRAAQQETRARYAALQSASDAFRGGRAVAFDERAALLERLWRAGEVGTSDYLVQLKQSLDTALSGLELESQAWLAWFDYLAAAGRLVDWIDGRCGEME